MDANDTETCNTCLGTGYLPTMKEPKWGTPIDAVPSLFWHRSETQAGANRF